MRLEQSTVDAYPEIIKHLNRQDKRGSRIGGMKEELGVVIRSDDPRQRHMWRPNMNLAFALQECFAYWNGLNPGHVERYNSNMERYIQDDGEMLGSAYGRYFRHLPHDQIERVIRQLEDSPETRRAVINIHNAKYEEYDSNDVACTVYLQFIQRDGYLNCIAAMRSQDMLWGFPYDTNAFQWIQEVIAGILGLQLGFYEHRINSCHYYTDFEEDIVESADKQKTFDAPDIRMDRLATTEAMAKLNRGLQKARKGVIPDYEITDLDDCHTYYGDWLRYMVAYESRRFHDADVSADYDHKVFEEFN